MSQTLAQRSELNLMKSRLTPTSCPSDSVNITLMRSSALSDSSQPDNRCWCRLLALPQLSIGSDTMLPTRPHQHGEHQDAVFFGLKDGHTVKTGHNRHEEHVYHGT
jgi:hypothetical protein